MKPVIALIGRPNVGKSTLLNQITKSRDALVADFAGLTRDRKYGDATYQNKSFIVVVEPLNSPLVDNLFEIYSIILLTFCLGGYLKLKPLVIVLFWHYLTNKIFPPASALNRQQTMDIILLLFYNVYYCSTKNGSN